MQMFAERAVFPIADSGVDKNPLPVEIDKP